ncbi:unnamed protein product [Brassica napus]|uniref:Peptidyl-prolyl cis-trans isomerase n=1 Tax=Brassica napus TaxID=3708 RepID=A0A816Y7R8_BRANA|nr:unnamed protein product [Brassica napus]
MSSRDQVKASHILIKHQGSRRKASWKDPEGKVIMTTTREAAVEQLKSIREDILSGKANFEDVAARVSDCSSAKRGGDLGLFRFSTLSDEFRFTEGILISIWVLLDWSVYIIHQCLKFLA